MTTIVIKEKELAIQVEESSFNIAKWVVSKNKKTGKVTEGWVTYLYPHSLDRAIQLVVQKIVSDQNLVISVIDFKDEWDKVLTEIYAIIHGHQETRKKGGA